MYLRPEIHAQNRIKQALATVLFMRYSQMSLRHLQGIPVSWNSTNTPCSVTDLCVLLQKTIKLPVLYICVAHFACETVKKKIALFGMKELKSNSAMVALTSSPTEVLLK